MSGTPRLNAPRPNAARISPTYKSQIFGGAEYSVQSGKNSSDGIAGRMKTLDVNDNLTPKDKSPVQERISRPAPISPWATDADMAGTRKLNLR